MSELDFERQVAVLMARGMGRDEARAQVGYDAGGRGIYMVDAAGISRPYEPDTSDADADVAALRLQLRALPVTVRITEPTTADGTD